MFEYGPKGTQTFVVEAIPEPFVERHCYTPQAEKRGLAAFRQRHVLDAPVRAIAPPHDKALVFHRVEVVGECRLLDADGFGKLALVCNAMRLESDEDDPRRLGAAGCLHRGIEGATHGPRRRGQVKANGSLQRAGHTTRLTRLWFARQSFDYESFDIYRFRMTTTPSTAHGSTQPATTARPWRLSGMAYKGALTSHVLSSVGWFGAAVLVAFCGVYAATGADGSTSHAMYRTMEAAPWLTIPLGLVAAATGLLLSVGTKWGIVRNWWVVAKIVIAVAVLVTDPLLVARGAHDAAMTGAAPRTLFGPVFAHVVLLASATVLSVFKPKGRTPYGRRVDQR